MQALHPCLRARSIAASRIAGLHNIRSSCGATQPQDIAPQPQDFASPAAICGTSGNSGRVIDHRRHRQRPPRGLHVLRHGPRRPQPAAPPRPRRSAAKDNEFHTLGRRSAFWSSAPWASSCRTSQGELRPRQARGPPPELWHARRLLARRAAPSGFCRELQPPARRWAPPATSPTTVAPSSTPSASGCRPLVRPTGVDGYGRPLMLKPYSMISLAPCAWLV